MEQEDIKLYIAVRDDFPDFMAPTLVAHTMLGAHLYFQNISAPNYVYWLQNSFKKCVVRVNQKEFTKIRDLQWSYVGRENKTLDGQDASVVAWPVFNKDLPNVLKFAKLWSPKGT